MAHAQKPDLVFPRNGLVHLNRPVGGREFSRLLAAEVCACAVVMLDTPFSAVECNTTGYPLHSHVSPSLPLPCVTVCHQVPSELHRLCCTWQDAQWRCVWPIYSTAPLYTSKYSKGQFSDCVLTMCCLNTVMCTATNSFVCDAANCSSIKTSFFWF